MRRRNNRDDRTMLARRSALLMLGLVASLALAPVAPAAAPSESISRFIETLGDEAIRQLSPYGITPDERERRFRELLRANFDLPRISRFVLGRYGRQATEAELREFQALYEDLMVLTYARLFATYAGETFAVRRAVGEPNERYRVVMTEVNLPNAGDKVRLDWQVLTEGNRHAVVDVRVEGVSMAIAQRDEYAAILERNGGKIAALLAELRTQVAKLKRQRAGS